MRIAYLLSASLPSRDTDTQQSLKTVDALAAEGAAITLLVPSSRSLRARGLAFFEERIRDVYGLSADFRLQPLRSVEPDRRIELHRLLHAPLGCVAARRGGFDLLYTRSRSAPLWSCALGVPFVLETFRPLGQQRRWLAALYLRLARSRRFLGVITHSRLAAAALAHGGFPSDRLATIPNGYDPGDLDPQQTREAARALLGLDPVRPMACYAGHVGAAKGVAALVEMARRTPRIEYVLVGGHDRERTALAARTRSMANLRLEPWRPARELAPWLRAADVLLIPPTAAPLRIHGGTVLPMKTFLYLAAGRAILAPDLPDLREVLVHGESAWLVPPDDPASAAAAIERLIDDPPLAAHLGRTARERSGGFTWRARARRILAQLEEWKGLARLGGA